MDNAGWHSDFSVESKANLIRERSGSLHFAFDEGIRMIFPLKLCNLQMNLLKPVIFCYNMFLSATLNLNMFYKIEFITQVED
jgi:hypothetical protein